MKKVLSFLGFRKFRFIDFFILLLFMAFTILLTVKFIIKFDSRADICLHFVPIIIIGALYGPFFGGAFSLAGYITGSLYFSEEIALPLCVTAFLSGFIYGWLFYNRCEMTKSFVKRMGLCVLLEFVLYVFIEGFLVSILNSSDFNDLISLRTIAAVVEMFLQAAFIMMAPKFVGAFIEMFNKGKEQEN